MLLPVAIFIKRLRVLTIARLLIATVFLFCAQFIFPKDRTLFYALIAACSILSIIYILWLLSTKKLVLLAWIQVLLDLVLESALVAYTGGVDSLFATVYVLSILSAGYILSPVASFYIATGSSICFIAITFFDYANWIPSGFFAPRTISAKNHDILYLFYSSYVRVTVFFLVAVLTYFFSQKIRKLESTMKTQERLVFLGEVISSIAHEIRNPLTSISGSVELMIKQLKAKLNEKQQKLMGAVVDESERINRIFSGLLDYSRLPELRLEEVCLESFLDQILMLVEHQESFNPKINILKLYKNKKIQVKMDPEYMKQVLMNILVNSFQAMPNGGKLEIDSHANRTEVSVSINDTGMGMDRKTLNSIFVPFKTTKSNGTGLGLAQAYKIVSQHGGRLSIRSKKEKGTQVEVFIPKL
ncbi:MAG: hypothetical protein HY583_01155 [Candidatus Omnitrophica bacterium]|nr:hypothetical protein [Candidatus Omnitrophota bacterium]